MEVDRVDIMGVVAGITQDGEVIGEIAAVSMVIIIIMATIESLEMIE